MFIKTESRGKDACGFYAFNHSGKDIINGMKSQLWKEQTTPSRLKHYQQGKFNFNSVEVFLAHTRASTQGSETEFKNNHPFETDDFVMAHNGGCQRHKDLKKELNLTYDSDCDSPVIIYAIQKRYNELNEIDDVEKRVEEAIIKGLTDVKEANMACWLVHKNSGRVFLWRNVNPIEFAIKENFIVFNSEYSPIKEFNVEIGDIKTLESYKIFEIVPNGDSKTFSLEAVADLPKVESSHGHYMMRKTITNTALETNLTSIVKLGERVNLIADKFKLEGFLVRRTDGMWLFTTKQEKFITMLNKIEPIKARLMLNSNNGEQFVSLIIRSDTINSFLDDIEEGAYIENYAQQPEGYEFIKWLKSLNGVRIEFDGPSCISIVVSDEESKKKLNKLGFSLNNNNSARIRARNENKLRKRLVNLYGKVKYFALEP